MRTLCERWHPLSRTCRVRTRSWAGWDFIEVMVAVAGFAVMCVVILSRATFMPEPDDSAYQASIVAMTEGHFLSLSTRQAEQLGGSSGGPSQWAHPSGGPPAPVEQWVRLPDGRWISEKDPGYPFLAVPFQVLGIIRWAPLFYGALACVGLFAGARRWLGRFGGAAAVGLYCSSAAALLWGWRDYMATFTDASLIAAGTGALLWAGLAAGARPRRRTVAGLAGFVALEVAVFTRYTDVVVLGCAVVAVLAGWRVRAVRLPRAALWWWLGSVAVFGAAVAVFDDLVYGGPLRSGYRPGEVQFSPSAIVPNLKWQPAHLMQAMPALVPALASLAWIIWRRVRLRRGGQAPTAQSGAAAGSGAGAALAARRDFAVALALAASWLAVWGLYVTYTWTAHPGGSWLSDARFYVPALGTISLLAAWLVTRLPRRAPQPALAALACVVAVAVMFVLGGRTFHDELAIYATRNSASCTPVPGTAKGQCRLPRPATP